MICYYGREKSAISEVKYRLGVCADGSHWLLADQCLVTSSPQIMKMSDIRNGRWEMSGN